MAPNIYNDLKSIIRAHATDDEQYYLLYDQIVAHFEGNLRFYELLPTARRIIEEWEEKEEN